LPLEIPPMATEVSIHGRFGVLGGDLCAMLLTRRLARWD
jgi:hypothetical protein